MEKKIEKLRQLIKWLREKELTPERVDNILFIAESIGYLEATGDLSNEDKKILNNLWRISNNSINNNIDVIVYHMLRHEKIQAIKAIRTIFKLGLKDAKDLYEQVERNVDTTTELSAQWKKELLRQYQYRIGDN